MKLAAHRTIEDLEAGLGQQVRALRQRRGLTQAELARDANVSAGAIYNLESGRGSSLKSLIAVLRALDRTEWLDGLAPAATVSPLALLAESAAKNRTRR